MICDTRNNLLSVTTIVTIYPETRERITILNFCYTLCITCGYVNFVERSIVLTICSPLFVRESSPRTTATNAFSAIEVTNPVHLVRIALRKAGCLTTILRTVTRSCFIDNLSCCEVEFTKCGTCKITIDVLHLTLSILYASCTTACHSESTTFRVDGEGYEVIIVQSWCDDTYFHIL